MAKTTEQIIDDIESGNTTLGIEYGSTRIKAVLDDSENNPIAVGTYDWENSYVDGYWTYPEDELLSGLTSTYLSLKSCVLERYGVTLERVGAMGISGMMHGYLPFDVEGNLLAPFRTWRNNATQAARELSELFEFHVPDRYSVSLIYEAVLKGESYVPDIAFCTTLAGYAHWMLTGEKVLSVGDAVGMFPIDFSTCSYDRGMIEKFDRLIASKGVPWRIEDLLPKVLVAGDCAGHLTAQGARLLDPEGDLEPGCPLCPPEGDGATGMIATNTVSPRIGNISAGTSISTLIVLERPLNDPTNPQIDVLATPEGDPVACVHVSNCSSDLNDWVDLLADYSRLMGQEVDKGELFTTLFNEALKGDKDAGGLVSIPFVSGEPILGVPTGYPIVLREHNSNFTIANFMRMNIMATFGVLAMGTETLLDDEGVVIDALYAQGGIFKTPNVAQSLLAAALEVPVTVLETAGEGGAWAQALAAAYMLHRGEGETFAEYLENHVFAGVQGTTIEPDPADVEGFQTFLGRFKKGLEVERAAEDAWA